MTGGNIIHENDDHYVWCDREAYVVFVPSPSGTHAVSDSAYELTEDGKSIAISRCDYLAMKKERS